MMKEFPWGALPKVSRADVAQRRLVMRLADPLRQRSFAEALAKIVDGRIELRVDQTATAQTPFPGGVAVLFGASSRPEISHAFLVEAEEALAATLIGKCLRREIPNVVAANTPAGGSVAGAWGAILHAALRSALDAPVRIIAAGPGEALATDHRAATTGRTALDLTVRVDEKTFAARVTVDPNILAGLIAGARPPLFLESLGDVRLSLPVIAAISTASRMDMAKLRRGDVWVPGSGAFQSKHEGPVWLAAPHAEEGIGAVLRGDGTLQTTTDMTSLSWTAESSTGQDEMAASEEKTDGLIEALGEVPVVVRVELGAVEMTAREWSQIALGDIVSLGQPLGELVSLRVGGRVVARGELVDFEGEMGIRIRERFESKETNR